MGWGGTKRKINTDLKYTLASRFSTVTFLFKKLIYKTICFFFFKPTLQPNPDEPVESLLGGDGQSEARSPGSLEAEAGA